MNRKQILTMADHMGVEVEIAIEHRLDWLRNKIHSENEYVKELRISIAKETDKLTIAFLKGSLHGIETNIAKLKKEGLRIKAQPSDDKDKISDDDIEAARNYPIDQLMEFSHGRCEAFCHESDTNSMSHMVAANRANCFVCNLSFNPIDVLMCRDNISFLDAVKQLR